jgi:ligand-binding sensor domain-containing protein
VVVQFIARGQEFSYRHYSIPEGLVQTQVQCIFQDSRGFLWIGTKGGVSRFDGKEFVNYTIKDGLSSDFVNRIHEDCSGSIWLIGRTGYTRIERSGKITKIFPDLRDFELTNELFCQDDKVYCLLNKPKRDLWLYEIRDGRMIPLNQIKFKNGSKPATTYVFAYSNIEKCIYVCLMEGGIFKYDLKTNYTLISDHLQFTNIHKCSDGNIYATTCDTVYRLSNNRLIPVTWEKGLFTHGALNLEADNQGNIIYCDSSLRINWFHNGTRFIDRFTFDAGIRFFFDKENNLWVGSDATGLYQLKSRAFTNYLSDRCGIPPYVSGIVEDQYQNIWFASMSKGLYRYNGSDFKEEKGYFGISRFPFFYFGSMLTSDKTLLLSHNINLFKFSEGKFSKVFHFPFNISPFAVLEDRQRGRLLCGSNENLVYKDQNGEEKQLLINPGNKKSKSVVSLSIDGAGRYWLGNFYGISIYDEGKVTHLPVPEYPYSGGATCQWRDNYDRLWLGGPEGLFLLLPNKLVQIAKKHFPSYVNAIIQLDKGHLLIGGLKGIGILDLDQFNKTGREWIDFYDRENGFDGIEVNQNGFFKDSRGDFWIITSDRVVRLNPFELKTNKISPPIIIKKLLGFGENMKEYELLGTWQGDTTVTLSSTDNKLKFEYAALSYTAPERISYQYQLEGYDKDWSVPVAENYAHYTNLSPGHYTFKVRAINCSGIISSKPAVIHLFIRPAFWQTWWFIFMVVLTVTGAVIYITLKINNTRRSKIQKEIEYEKALIDLQLKTIRNQIDPHFTFNALNSIAAVIYKEDKQTAYTFFSRFSGLVRAVLEASDKTERSLMEEIEFVRNYLELEKFRFKDKFNYALEVDPSCDLLTPVPKLIIQAYAENAIKHGLMHKELDGFLQITVKSVTEYQNLEKQGYLITITDNGIGRSASKAMNQNNPLFTGKGLHIMEDYFRLFEKIYHVQIRADFEDLTGPSGESLGTSVIVFIPDRKPKSDS